MSTCETPVHFAGWGADVPSAVLHNEELEQRFGVEEGWIASKTGIGARRVVAPDQSSATLATNAARSALTSAGLAPSDIDVIVLATCTPEQLAPHTAAFVGGELGISCGSFDLNTACTGFVYGLVVTGALLNASPMDRALLIGVEAYSRFINPEDRGTAVVFGDGAGALVLDRAADASGILGSDLGCEGSLTDIVGIRAGGSRMPPTPDTVVSTDYQIHMKGKPVYEFAVGALVESIDVTLARASVDLADVKWFVPHQANLRIIEAVGEKIHIDPDRVVLNIERFGNTGAASIPIGLAEAADDGRLQRGDLVLVSSVGAGMTWATALIRW
ncbi:MAG: ketoacyl-ACP synthase III [Actinomycetota bacterium]|nr:ketoacyl-ACP synthase III [Actinomycetota bacterium]